MVKQLSELGTDCISRQDALESFGLSEKTRKYGGDHSGYDTMMMYEIQDTIEDLPPIQPEIIYCKDCKHNPKYEWFGCPMSHLSEKQRPETAWCWKAERRTDEE